MQYAFFFSFALLLSLPNRLPSQTTELRSNPNIIWLAEYEQEYSFHIDKTSETYLHRIPSKNGECSLTIHHWLKEIILNSLKVESKIVYSNVDLTKPLSKRKIKKLFRLPNGCTISKDDIAAELKPFVTSPLWYAPHYRTREALFFDEQNGKLMSKILAIAPLSIRDGGTNKRKPLAWIKLDNEEKINKNPDGLAFISSTSKNNRPVEIDSLTIRKGLIDFRDFIYNEAINGQNIVSATFDNRINEIIYDTKKIEEFYVSFDTLFVFDRNTYEEKIKVIKHEFSPHEINKFQLIQDWFYDPKNHEINTVFRALAPVQEVTDSHGNHLHERPLYYIVY